MKISVLTIANKRLILYSLFLFSFSFLLLLSCKDKRKPKKTSVITPTSANSAKQQINVIKTSNSGYLGACAQDINGTMNLKVSVRVTKLEGKQDWIQFGDIKTYDTNNGKYGFGEFNLDLQVPKEGIYGIDLQIEGQECNPCCQSMINPFTNKPACKNKSGKPIWTAVSDNLNNKGKETAPNLKMDPKFIQCNCCD